MTKHEELAKELFLQGYNCAQAVFCSFEDLTGIDRALSAKLSSSFGGGLARLREVCGAVSGMAMVLGVLFGYDDPLAKAEKKEHYERVRLLIGRFEEENGSYLCRELLGEKGRDTSPVPEARSEAYYKKRPCAELVAIAARLLDEYLDEIGFNKKGESDK